MNLYTDVLDRDTLELVLQDIKSIIHSNVWNTSSTWNPDLIQSGFPTCRITEITNDRVRQNIAKDISSKIPKCNLLMMNYYLWGKGSCIDVHSDRQGYRSFGGTIYLNEIWEVKDGGLFVWEEREDDWKVVVPKFNTMIINDQFQRHLVTPVSLNAKEYRITIQLWGETYEVI
jgi:hypothetical protein